MVASGCEKVSHVRRMMSEWEGGLRDVQDWHRERVRVRVRVRVRNRC